MAAVLRTSARERAAQVPIRLVLAGVLSWALQAIGRGDLVGPWIGLFVFTQGFEWLAMAPFRARRPVDLARRRRILPALAAVLLMSTVHAGIAALIWRQGQDLVLVSVAVMILAGGLLTNVGSGIESRALFLLGAAPYFLAVATAPILLLGREPAGVLALMAVAMILFIGAIYTVWARAHGSWRAEAVAHASAELRLQQAELAMADRAAMAAIVSHELRTPLSAIVAGAQLVRRAGLDARTAETADLIADASRLMTGMLNDLLDHSKIEARAMSLEARDFDACALARDTAKFWRAPAEQKGLTLSLALRGLGPDGAEAPCPGPVWLRGDPYRLRQILNNLVSNAIKFSPDGEVGLILTLGPPEPAGGGDGDNDGDGAGPRTAARRRLRLTVRDQGPGIAAERVEGLFTPFAQASAEVARTYGGTGLGLTVSRDLARLMGGQLTVGSVVGEGSAFLLDLALPEGQPAAGEDDYLTAAPSLERALKVLAVDDHEINRRTLALVLQPLDVQLWTAADGASALAILAEQRFDAVLMDVNMPEIDGLEATRRLRAEGGLNAGAPVIGFSAATEPEQVEACYAAGMTDWLPKPLEPKRLYAALERAVKATAAEAATA